MSELRPPGQAKKSVVKGCRSSSDSLQPRVTPRENDSETETLLEQLARRVFELNRELAATSLIRQPLPAGLTIRLKEIGALLELPAHPTGRIPSGEWSRQIAGQIDQLSARFKPLDVRLRSAQGDDERKELNAEMSTLNAEVRRLLNLRMSVQMVLVRQQLIRRNRPAACAALIGLYATILDKDRELFQERVREYRSRRVAEFQSPHWVATILEMLRLKTWDVKVGSDGKITIPQNRYTTRTTTQVIDGKEVKVKVQGARLMDITYEALEDALRSQAHTIENYGPDFLDVIYHIGELGYARRLLRRNASASARRRARHHLEGVYQWAARGHVAAKTRTTDELKSALRVLESIDIPEPKEGENSTQTFAQRLAFIHERINASSEALKAWRLPDIQYIRARVELRLSALLSERGVSTPSQEAPAPEATRELAPVPVLKRSIEESDLEILDTAKDVVSKLLDGDSRRNVERDNVIQEHYSKPGFEVLEDIQDDRADKVTLGLGWRLPESVRKIVRVLRVFMVRYTNARHGYIRYFMSAYDRESSLMVANAEVDIREDLEGAYYQGLYLSNISGDYRGQALMQRSIVLLLLSGRIKRWRSPVGLGVMSKKMHDRFLGDGRFNQTIPEPGRPYYEIRVKGRTGEGPADTPGFLGMGSDSASMELFDHAATEADRLFAAFVSAPVREMSDWDPLRKGLWLIAALTAAGTIDASTSSRILALALEASFARLYWRHAQPDSNGALHGKILFKGKKVPYRPDQHDPLVRRFNLEVAFPMMIAFDAVMAGTGPLADLLEAADEAAGMACIWAHSRWNQRNYLNGFVGMASGLPRPTARHLKVIDDNLRDTLHSLTDMRLRYRQTLSSPAADPHRAA